MTNRIGLLGFGLVLLFATSATAQVTSPPPTLQGQAATHLWTVPGVVNNGVSTAFACTNVTSANIVVGVEVFGPAGGAALNDASATSLTALPGGTVTFGTSSFNGFTIDANLDSALSPGTTSFLVLNGSARILATAKSGVICTALLVDRGSHPPAVIGSLPVVKKTTQQGD